MGPGVAAPLGPVALPPNFPSLAELEAMEADEIDELLGLKPKFDIPPAARRAVRQVGVIDAAEGGFAAGLLDNQPPALIRAALAANRGPLVSRWGHILLRRALASRMDAPKGMNPVTFAALRAGLLNRMGEGETARALVQDVDSANYDTALASAAFDAYLATGDLLGMCPVALLKSTLRDDPEWKMTRWICAAYAGNGREAERQLQRMLYYGEAPRIDALAGAALRRRRGRGAARGQHRVGRGRRADAVALGAVARARRRAAAGPARRRRGALRLRRRDDPRGAAAGPRRRGGPRGRARRAVVDGDGRPLLAALGRGHRGRRAHARGQPCARPTSRRTRPRGSPRCRSCGATAPTTGAWC